MGEEARAYEAIDTRDHLQAWVNLLQANRVVQDRIEDRLQAAVGLSLAQHEVLLRLAAAADGRFRMFDLAGLLLISKSGATRLIDRLVEHGLVARAPCAEDRRVVYAQITERGREMLARAHEHWQRAIDEVFSQHLSDQDVRALRRALRKVLDGNGAWEEARCTLTPVQEPAKA